ncbi:hypothetical protein CFE70_010549, partial [Pyrenophora teres f. teres 0-1]
PAAVASMPLLRDPTTRSWTRGTRPGGEDGNIHETRVSWTFSASKRRLPVAGCRQGLCGGDDYAQLDAASDVLARWLARRSLAPETLLPSQTEHIEFVSITEALDEQSAEKPGLQMLLTPWASATSLAYVMFTSDPPVSQGVMVEHRGALCACNSGAYVMDSGLRLVPLGVVGELVVTATAWRGYTDPARNVDRFVSVEIGGKTVRAYRTGDYVAIALPTASWSSSAAWTARSRSEETGGAGRDRAHPPERQMYGSSGSCKHPATAGGDAGSPAAHLYGSADARYPGCHASHQNGKVDRKALEQQIDTQKGSRAEAAAGDGDAATMQQLWAGVLAIDADSIGLDDSFFRLGGDSIAAMKLVGEARRAGIHLTVADLFRNPKLEAIREEVAASCNTNTSLIEDIYPCSPLQEGMMALASKRPGDYIMQSVLALHDDTDEDRFRAAWERVVQSTAVLRTRIVHSSKMGMLQVVLADGIEWEQANELEQYLEKDKSVSMGLGDSLARYALVRDVGTGKRWMVWTLHHALYDGWSLPQIANLVTEVYHGAEVGKQPGFNAFIKYLGEQDHEAAAAYWQGTLADCQAISFPALPPAVQQPVADATTAFQCPALARRPSDITMSTLIRAAWALLASSYTSSDDVVFGATVTGRNAPVAGIEAMAGPTIATVPVRVRVQHSHKVSEFLHSVQQQATEMIPYEQTGLHETAKVSADARHACSFQTLLIVQPGSNGDIAHDALGEWRSHSDLQDFTTYALMVQCVLADDEVQIIASFDRRAIEPWQVDKMLRQQQLWEWNHDVPPAIERCIHDLFADQAKARPDAPAICAWDGDMTYGELDVLSGRLAGHLVELGVGPEDIVPLCFEKSMWTVVAMLAVLKAGGAFLLLDPSLPHERLRLMCRKVSAKLSLASEASAPLAKDLVGTVVIVNADSALQLAHHASPITSVRPTHTAYVIFTSGSTGEPKGCRIEHRAASSAVTAHGRYLGMQASTRTLQFASYAFAGSLAPVGAVAKDGEDGMLACFIVVEDSASNEDELSGKRTRLDTRTQRTIGKIQDRLERFLPQYMVPAVFIPILTLPVTWSKKIDRKRLREVGSTFSGRELAELQATTQGLKRQPSTENEKALQQLWAGVLAIDADSIGLDDSFFRLGGDSIAAMKLVGEARRAGIHLTVADLFRNPKLDQLTAAAIASAHASPASIPQVEHAGPVAQSFAQGRLWFLEELHPGLTWYLMPLAVRIRGPLDLVALHSALLAVERRHETLRTTFATVDGASVQVVQPFQAKDLNIIDIVPGDEQGLTEAVHQDHSTPFDLRTEPGWRVTVYRMSNDDHVLSTVMHHIISDGWSVDVLMRELAAFYSASMRGQDPLSQVQPLSVQYRDFSAWQREQAQADEHQKQLSYWVEQLQSSRPAELLCDKPRPAALSGEAGFVVLLAAFRATHFRLTGQEDATIGTPNANRDRWEVKDMVGFFVNMQCLRIKIGDESFEELVQQVHEVAVASHANADVPFENIVSKLKNDRDLSRHPLVQLVFAVHAQRDLGQLKLEGVETENLGDTVTSRFDLEFHFSQQADGLWGSVMFSTDLYAPETIDNMLSVFRRVLETCLEQPQAAVASMPLLRDADYAKLDAMGLVRVEKTAYPRDSSVVDLFREQAAACPSRVAVKDSVAEMTYAQLDAASDVLARWLARRSLAPETLVGVFASRSCEAIVAFLGILKANLAYLPFDVKTPATRMEDILSSRPGHRLILVGAGAQLPSTKLSNIEFVSITEALDEQSAEKPGLQMPTTPHGPSATSLAYVMFTSGSTGQPKGVMVEHRGIVRLVRDNNLVQHLPSSPVMAHMANLAFDATTLEIYACLLHGGTLVCVDSATVLEVEAVLRMFREHHISTAFMAPSLFRTYALQSPGIFAALDMLYVGGEAVYPHDLVAASECLGGRLVNAYGPTENTVASTSFLVSKEEAYANGVPIGRALSNSGAYVMDSGLRLVPLGVVGELVVTGDGLARGYTDPARNVDRFVSVEIGGKTVRAYRTGDYVRHRPTDGQLEFFGRMDGQVKIRGNRVELGEIEHTLRSDKVVREAVAVLQQHDGSEARLAGFVTVHEDAETADEHVDDSNESQHVDVWEEKFDADIYSPIDSVQAENIGRDFVGWTSMYDGSDIDKAEMNEWLDDTIATMLNGQRPGNVLEIGSGTGMILFNLGDGLQSYVGLDPSRKAVQFIAETAKSIPGLASKIRMYKATAADVGRLEQPVAASLVVVNSVVQYFPSLDYLFKMVQQLVELEGTRTLFFGDVRSCALHREFLATRAVHMAGDKATKADIRRMVADMERVERELLVDPAFFTALPSRLPGLVEHVEILPKKMKATNELSCYRYAAVVHVRPRDGQTQELAIRDVAHDRWIDFAERRLDRQSLLQQLKSLSSAPAVAVSNIPYSKTIVSRCLVHSLDGTEAETPDSPDWLASVHQRAQDCPSLSATELVELAQEVDCRVEISWSRQHSQQGGLDAIFHRYQPLTGERVMFRFPTDHAERPLHSLSSRPLRQQFLQKTQQRLLEMLEAQLPTYMVPQTLAILDAMPVNQNGKVDRKALEQQIDTQKGQSGLKRQPETETQRTMQQLWAGVLAIDADSIGLDDSFFRLGGDSIAAMKLVGEARRAGIHLTVADLFRNPKLDQLTAAAIASAHASPASIPQVEHAGPVAQSFAQGRLWFLEELHPGLTWYLMPLAVRIRGPLDLVALHSALLAVERRHETLRTTFATVDGASVQVVQPFQAKDLNIIDIVPGDEQGLTEAVHQDHSTPFDLRTEPGWRVTVYRMSNDDHVLSTVMHHIISDGWSVDVLMRELAAFYSASMRGQDPLSQVQPLSVQYRDFSAWQREQAQADEHQKQLSYWVEQLQSSRPAELLCDKPRPAALSGEAGVQSIEIAGPLYAKLQSFCQLHGVTQFVVLLAAFRATHFRLTGQEDATIGTPNANRDRWEVKDMVGFFVNMQCLRIKIGDESFEELVQQVHEVAVASHANADVPFENIVSKLKNDRDLSRHPLVQLVFAVHAQRDLGQLKLEGVETENLGDTVTSRFDLEFHFSQQADGLWGSVMFSTDLYAPETIDNMLSVFRRVLETCLEQPQAAVASMPLLRDADYAKLDAMGLVRVEKTAYPRDSSVVDLFREQAAACPSRVAVKDSVAEMTYAQLDAASDVLARWLARRSLAPETLVGVFASRSCEAIVAFLGILKANLAYLPFDVKTPATRMEDILSSRPGHRLILVGAGAQLPSTKLSNIEFVSITEALDEQSAEEPGLQMPTTPHGPSATSLAYVMFTSGSTGQPKGVMVEHRGIVRLVRDNNLVQHLPSSPVMAHMANLAFDASMWEIYNSLLNCGTLICVDAATVLDAQAVLQTFRQHNITTAFFTPSLLRTYVRQSPRLFCRLDMLCVGGEVLHPSDMLAAREHLAGQLINGYGPTENSATSTLYVTCDNDNSTNGVPIGRALSNSGAYVMDSGLRLVPLGVVGELVVTGDGLARGYTDPARNVDRFVSVEIGGKTVRAYRTGDYVRHRPTDGQLEFFGRMDGQVKIRGNRVELGEIEHALRSDKSVREAVTVLQQPDGSEARLAGFVTLHECTAMAEEKADHTDGAPHADARKQRFLQNTQRRLVEMLEAQLPTYMVPQTLAILDAMPVNQNGKVDRKALEQQIDTQKGQSGLKRQPETETQRTMQQLWAGVLAIDADSIGLDDSFFRLGGDSIAAMKLVGEARRAGIHLTVADLFRNPKLDQLTAAAIASAHASPASIPQVEHAGPVAQSFAQGRLWFLEELHPGLTWYLMPLAVRIRGPLDLVALHSALLAVERRHETLRTTFATVDGASVQVVQPFQAKDLNIIDIVPGDEQGLTEAVHQDHSTPFDLRTEPGWRVTVYRMSNDDHVLSTVMHHIISDGWSVDVLMRELAAFYSASMRGQDPLSQVQPLSVQYRDFSAWQREQAQADEHQKQLSYWVEQLQSSRPAELLCDKPRPAALSGEAGVQSIEIAGPLYAKLQSFCQLHGVTQFVVLLAAFRATHFRLTGQEDATIGTPNANRDRWEVKDMVGFFVNMQCLRIKIGDESFEELVQQVHEVAVASHANADVPFENIVSKLKNDRDLSRHPLVQLVFAVHAQRDLGQLKLEGVETENLGDTVTSRFDLEFHFSQQADGLWGSVMFSTDLYAPETIDNMLSVFRRVLETCLEQPQAAVASMPLLRDADYAKLDAMGLVRVEKTAYPRDSSVVDLFREQAAACPSRVAVKDSVAEMTYAQLDAASDVLARWLARRSLAPETLVGVFASRSCEAIVAFLGILKANLAYLPFDVKTPATRMEDILSSRPGHRLILVGAGAQLPSTKLSNIEFVSITEALDEQSAEEPGLQMPTTPHGPSATSLAYVMFTSGSTGQPKGVMVEHRGIVRLVRDNNLVQHLPSSPVMAHMANLAFDASTWEIYGTLLCGGTLVCIDAAMVLDAEAMLQTSHQHNINTAFIATSLFRAYAEQSPALIARLEMVCVGGERMHEHDLVVAREHLAGKFMHVYGPTENTTFSTTFLVSKNEQYTNGVPIGRALSNSGAYVMDSGLRLVPLGVVGELVVTGDGLARGYTDPARNVDRFVSVEIGGKTVRAYRTGDYVRHRPTDGQLEFFGRMDGQVKIRGNRVELGEIEHTLRSDKSVREAVTVLQQPDGSEARLAGFVTLHECTAMAEEKADHTDGAPHVDVRKQRFLQNTQRRLVEMLEAQLPTYMVPQTLAILDAMPVNQNGKVDRKALEQQIDTQKGQSGLKRQPETETQRTMQQLWAGVLAIDADSIGLDDSFFRLGGDSIAAMKLVGEARRAGIHLTVADLFRNPKLIDLVRLESFFIQSIDEDIPAFSLLGHDAPIIHAVTKAYTGGVIEKQIGFHAFIKYLGQQDQDSTATYWRTTLANCQATLFPPLPPTIQQPLANATIIYQCPPLPKAASDTTKSILIRAAWAILASRYTNSDDVVFGVTVTGRNAPVTNIETMAGPTIATVPLRVRVRGDQTVSDFLKFLQQQATDMITYEQTGLQHIAKMGPSARHACGFQTLLLVQPAEYTFGNDKVIGEWLRHSQFQGFSTYVLMLQFTLAAEGVQIMANFDARVMEQWVLKKMLGQFSFILQQLAEPNPERELANIDTITTEDRRELWAWNKNVPRTIDRCIHDLFAEQVLAQPNAPAICAWDGEMSYSVLDGLSTKLAGYLVKIGVKPGDVVPLCFEKSMWTVVAMLAVLKAGGAFAPLDPDHPVSRHKEILRQTGARMVVVSAQHSARWASSSCHVVTLSEASIGQLTVEDDLPGFSATPGNAAYVLFTSGSTGIPKGVVLEHRAVSTSCLGHGRAFGITDQSRVLQFTSYTFDFCMAEIITTLLYGGCICVPSDRDRHSDLAKAINTMGANWALLTPSVAQLLNPSDVPTLKILVIGGEQVTSKDWNRWPTSVQLINGYGPTECCIVCTGYTTTQAFKTGTIGTAIASVSWVVDPEDYHKLAPLGSVGELLVEGPILARGYLNDAEKTAAAFIEDPAWLVDGCQGYAGRRGRLYKTGDLVRYDDEGNLVCLGRKDSQVKLRGQRIELGEVEHALRSDKSVRQAVAVLQKHASNEVRLAGFVTVHEDAETADGHVDNSKESQIVDIWEERFDADVYSPIDSVQAENIGRDFLGWTSMYDGSDIDKAEMNEWLDDTIATMLNGQRPGNVLEIGSGTGMILFNLGDGLQSYVGLDPSRKAVQFIAETAKSIPGLASKIRMYKATAADVGRLEQPVAASLVVVNSVVQYFPSLDYLFKMVQQLVELEGTRTLFFGDVRSCALHREFLATRAVHMAGDKATKADIRRMVADMERVERELLVDPAFFTALPSRLPGLVEHVEILPKKMKATNELSCYRYAAVVHVRPRDGQTQELAIRDVAHDRWIDFAERRLDRQSLLQQLKSLSSAPAVAVSNIPYSKTIVSRCLVHSLDGTEAETPDSPDWLASVHQRAQDCPSLSATELVELAQEVDCRVEISWSRQHSQQGGLDAIFHRYQPLTGERVMFRFPTDHAERPLHSLSSRPLRQQFLQKTQQRLLEMLEAQLPTYMVPQTLAILDAMPVNQNGKVDRKALEQQIDTQKGQSGLKRQPETETQRTMQQLWAGVLAIDADSIGLDDSFFRLGGDSIAAMKLVGEARRAGIHLTVADVFLHPNLVHLCGIIQALSSSMVDSVLPFTLLQPDTKELILSEWESLGKMSLSDNTADILPVTFSQRLYVSRGFDDPRVAFDYLYIEMGPDLDLDLLRDSCRKLIVHFSILRTRFVFFRGRWFQIVLRDLMLPFSVFDVNESLDEASHAICMQDIERTDPLGVPTYFKVVRNKSTSSRLILRLSHAQYDGVCLPIVLRSLISIYQQEPLHPVAEFSTFLAHARKIQTLSGRYWRELLQGSRPIRVTEKLRLQVQEDVSPRLVSVEKYMDAPRLPEGITMASLISSAWALVLAHITGEQDIVFGHLVAGRNSDIPEVAEIVGPCLNVIPVRTLVYPFKTSKDLIQSVQDQHVSLGESDSMGWDEIVKDCTDWPAGTMFDSLVQHQNVVTQPELHLAGSTAKLEAFRNPFAVVPYLSLFSQPEDSQLKIMISGNTHFLTVERASLLVDMLAQTAQALSYSPQASLASHRLSLPGCAFNDG